MSDYEERYAQWKANKLATDPRYFDRMHMALLNAIAKASVEDRVMTVVEDPSTLECVPWALAAIANRDAVIARLTVERDEAIAGCRALCAEDNELRAELDRARAVVEAARRWGARPTLPVSIAREAEHHWSLDALDEHRERVAACTALLDAVTAFDAQVKR